MVCLAGLAILGILDRRFGGSVRTVLSHVGSDWGDFYRYHGKHFPVVRVLDGDTFDIDIPDGTSPTTRVRLLGVDTPEKGTDNKEGMFYGQQATEFTTHLVLNKEVTLLIDTVGDVRCKYGRLLAYVVLPDGSILNERIIQQGYGYADTRFSHSRYDPYLRLQEQACAERTGLWAEVAKDQFPPWLQRERPDYLP